jgi:hypothetical protein
VPRRASNPSPMLSNSTPARGKRSGGIGPRGALATGTPVLLARTDSVTRATTTRPIPTGRRRGGLRTMPGTVCRSKSPRSPTSPGCAGIELRLRCAPTTPARSPRALARSLRAGIARARRRPRPPRPDRGGQPQAERGLPGPPGGRPRGSPRRGPRARGEARLPPRRPRDDQGLARHRGNRDHRRHERAGRLRPARGRDGREAAARGGRHRDGKDEHTRPDARLRDGQPRVRTDEQPVRPGPDVGDRAEGRPRSWPRAGRPSRSARHRGQHPAARALLRHRGSSHRGRAAHGHISTPRGGAVHPHAPPRATSTTSRTCRNSRGPTKGTRTAPVPSATPRT